MAFGVKRATFHSETVLKLQKRVKQPKKGLLQKVLSGGLLYIIKQVQKGAFCCGTNPSILDNRLVRGGSRDHHKKHKKFNNLCREVVQRLVKMDLRLAAVHLVDSHYCSDPAKFISGRPAVLNIVYCSKI